MKILKSSDYKKMKWKNGLGVSYEIAACADFRISSAEVSVDSDFSLYPEHNRFLMVLSGKGVDLKNLETNKIHQSCDCFEIVHFHGNLPLRGILIDGPVRDLNIFYKNNASVEKMNLTKNYNLKIHAKRDVFLFLAKGELQVANDVVRTWDTIQLDANDEVDLCAAKDSILVRIEF